MSEDRPLQRGDLVRLRNLGHPIMSGFVNDDGSVLVEEDGTVNMLVEHVYTEGAPTGQLIHAEATAGDARVLWFDADRRLQVDLLPGDLLVRVLGCDDRDPSITLPDLSGPEPTF